MWVSLTTIHQYLALKLSSNLYMSKLLSPWKFQWPKVQSKSRRLLGKSWDNVIGRESSLSLQLPTERIYHIIFPAMTYHCKCVFLIFWSLSISYSFTFLPVASPALLLRILNSSLHSQLLSQDLQSLETPTYTPSRTWSHHNGTLTKSATQRCFSTWLRTVSRISGPFRPTTVYWSGARECRFLFFFSDCFSWY